MIGRAEVVMSTGRIERVDRRLVVTAIAGSAVVPVDQQTAVGKRILRDGR